MDCVYLTEKRARRVLHWMVYLDGLALIGVVILLLDSLLGWTALRPVEAGFMLFLTAETVRGAWTIWEIGYARWLAILLGFLSIVLVMAFVSVIQALV